MPSFVRAVAISALFALVNSQAVVLKAVGDKGESAPLGIDPKNPNDNNFISDAEIGQNIVNECGRTQGGNIDVGEQSEIALTNKQVTTVTKGSKVVLTIKQGNAQGAGPFTCELDEANNVGGLTGRTVLQTKEVTKNGNIEVTATMPANLTCFGGSTGDLGMIRCRNAQNFGGCVAIQQTDVTPHVNTPENIKTAGTLAGVLTGIDQSQRDLKIAAAAIAGASINDQGKAVADALVKSNAAVLAAAAANNTAGPAKKNNNNAKKKKNNNAAATRKNNAKANTAKAKANAKAATAAAKKNKAARSVPTKRELFRAAAKRAISSIEQAMIDVENSAEFDE